MSIARSGLVVTVGGSSGCVLRFASHLPLATLWSRLRRSNNVGLRATTSGHALQRRPTRKCEPRARTRATRELKRIALRGIGRNDNSDAAATTTATRAQRQQRRGRNDNSDAGATTTAMRAQRQQRRGRNDNSDGAATYLIRVLENEKDIELRKSAVANVGRVPGPKSFSALTSTIDGDTDVELQKQAVLALGRRAKDESVPVLIRVARNHPQMPVRKVAIQVLGQTGDQRAVAFFSELLSKD